MSATTWPDAAVELVVTWHPFCSVVQVPLVVLPAAGRPRARFASRPDEAPEFVTAWHTPPDTPSHEPVLDEPRGFSETVGSVAPAAEVTLPVQVAAPWHMSVAPDTDAADGPAGSRAALVAWS